MQKVYDTLKKYRELLGVIMFISIVASVVIIFINFFYSPIIVVGNSMYPALNADDVILVDIIGDDYDEIERFDIIVFPYKYNIKNNVIKRVIGLPGDTVEIKDDVIYINGKKLSEYYGYYDASVESEYSDMEPVQLSFDEYFVMGDNRNVSDDSRSPDIGVIKQDTIIGKAAFRLWPFNSIGSLEYQ